MGNDYSINLIGKICWMPPHRTDKPRFPPATIIRALAKFTSNFEPSYTIIVSYSPVVDQDCCDVRLSFPFGIIEEIKRLANRSELLIMDGYKVIAVCRNLAVPEKSGQISDSWDISAEN